jgi:hypothetical protein
MQQITPTRQISSNIAPFVLCPVVKRVRVGDRDIEDEDTCSATIRVDVNPLVRKDQRVLLSLYEWSVENPATYLLDAPGQGEDSGSLSIPVRRIKRGNYLVRLIVDGAESQLDIDRDPDSDTYNWYSGPRIRI